MAPVKIGIVGVGWISQVVHLPILTRLHEGQVVAVCDRDRSRVRLVAEKFGIPNVYTDLGRMLDQEELSAIVVATSTDAHKEVTLEALRRGKDVLVEKPIARTYAEAVTMAEAAKAADRVLMVGMNHRFRPDTMLLKSFLTEKEIGKIVYTRASWLRKQSSNSAWLTQKERSGGGVLLDLGIVLLDITFWLMDYPSVKKVSSVHFRERTRSVEDTALVNITMKNGSMLGFEVSWSMSVPDELYSCQIYGTAGSASLNPFRIHKELHGNVVNLTPAKLEPPQTWYKRSYENELKHFLGAVNRLHPVISTADEAVQRMRVLDALYRSARTGREVTLA